MIKRNDNSEKVGDKRYSSPEKPVEYRIHQEEPIGVPRGGCRDPNE